jgi:hypothetical protein
MPRRARPTQQSKREDKNAGGSITHPRRHCIDPDGIPVFGGFGCSAQGGIGIALPRIIVFGRAAIFPATFHVGIALSGVQNCSRSRFSS